MTRADLQPVFDEMARLVTQVQAITDGIGADDLRLVSQDFLNKVKGYIASWEGSQLDEVFAGTRDAQKWKEYGRSIAFELQQQIKDQSGFAEQFSHFADVLGNFAVDLLSPFKSKVDELAAKVKRIHELKDATDGYKRLLDPKALSSADKKLLFGVRASAAEASLKGLDAILATAQRAVHYLETGEATFGTDAKGKPAIVAAAPSGLGVDPVTLVTITVIVLALATAATLITYYVTAAPRARAEAVRLVGQKGTPEQAIAFAKAQAKEQEAESHNPANDPLSAFEYAIEKLFEIAAVAGLGWGAWKLVNFALAEKRKAERKAVAA